jgi:two-component system response regulator AtoC
VEGNVRSLKIIERAIILCDGKAIMPEHISLSPLSFESYMKNLPMDGALEDAAREALRIAETQRIIKALKETKGNKSRAAEILQVSYKTLLTKIKEYHIEA